MHVWLQWCNLRNEITYVYIYVCIYIYIYTRATNIHIQHKVKINTKNWAALRIGLLYRCLCQLAQSTNTQFYSRIPFKLRELSDNDEPGSKKLRRETNIYISINECVFWGLWWFTNSFNSSSQAHCTNTASKRPLNARECTCKSTGQNDEVVSFAKDLRFCNTLIRLYNITVRFTSILECKF